MEEKRYRVVASKYEIESVFEDGEFITAVADDKIVIAGFKNDIRSMLTTLGINCDKLNDVQ